MQPGRFRFARRFPRRSGAGRELILSELRDLLDWRENRRRRPARPAAVLFTAFGLVIGWMLRGTLRRPAWHRDRGRRLPAMASPRPAQRIDGGHPAPTPPASATHDLPAPIVAPAPAAALEEAPEAREAVKRTVLVVDDDRTARRTITTILTRASFDVSEAGTVAEALRGLAGRPDWIVLDLMLPDGSGCGVLREVSGQGSPSRVCVVSGAGPAMLGEARSLGARHVLSKPLDVPRLMSILAT